MGSAIAALFFERLLPPLDLQAIREGDFFNP